MSMLNARVWRKAYMLEFLEGEIPVLKDCFTFSAPPESEELQFPQRLSETKTFGGVVFDNYGNDTIKITLTGSTINEEKKFIYRGNDLSSPLYLTGTREIFELQKLIYNWSKVEPDKKFKKVYLYDLSKMTALQIATGTATRNYWRVFIKDLKIKREKSKPHTFNYTLEMLATMDDEKGTEGWFNDGINNFAEGFSNAMESLQSVTDYAEAIGDVAEEAMSILSKTVKTLEDIEAKDLSAIKVISATTQSADTVSRILTGNTNNTFYNLAKNGLSIVGQITAICKGAASVNKDTTAEETSSFKIFFDTNGGSSIPKQYIYYCAQVVEPAPPTKENYMFSGWFTDSELITEYDFSREVVSDFTLYAKWTLSIATISFNSMGGSAILPQSVAVGSRITNPPENPEKDGYVFFRWCIDIGALEEYDFSEIVSEDLTLYGAWVKTYKIIFDTNGGSEISEQIVNTGSLVVYPLSPTKENFTFAYWCIDSDLTTKFDFSTEITSDTTLYAVYVQITNTLYFNSKGGSPITPQFISIGDFGVEPAAPVRDGYDFIFWCSDNDATNEFHFTTTPINENRTLYARWEISTFEISFDSNEGSEVETQSIEYCNKVIFPEIPTKENRIFIKWCIDSELTTEYDFSTEVTSDFTLYAKWLGA